MDQRQEILMRYLIKQRPSSPFSSANGLVSVSLLQIYSSIVKIGIWSDLSIGQELNDIPAKDVCIRLL